MSESRVNVSDKFIFGGKSDVNQLVPFKYNWVWEQYLKANERHWMPNQFNFIKDKVTLDAQGEISVFLLPQLRKLIGLLSSKSNQVTSTGVGIYGAFSSPEHRQYMLRLNFEESLHGHLAQHLADRFNMDHTACHNAWVDTPYADMLRKSKNDNDERLANSPTAFDFATVMFEYAVYSYLVEQTVFYHIMNLCDDGDFPQLNEAIKRVQLDRNAHMSFFLSTCYSMLEETDTVEGSKLAALKQKLDDFTAKLVKIAIADDSIDVEQGHEIYCISITMFNLAFSRSGNPLRSLYEALGGTLMINAGESVSVESMSKDKSVATVRGKLEW